MNLEKLIQLFHYPISLGFTEIDLGKVITFFLLLALAIIIAHIVAKLVEKKLFPLLRLPHHFNKVVKRFVFFAMVVIGFFQILTLLGVDFSSVANLFTIINVKLFTIGETPVGLGSIVLFLVLIILVIILSRTISNFVLTRGLAKVQMDPGTKYVLKRVTEYSLITIGAIIAFQTIGINLSGLAVIFGLLSVGIGFGLQNITSNFISGMILLFERPIKVGDRITVGDTQGDVEEINIRATTIRSLDNISMIVPNSEFVQSKVMNWSHGDIRVRINVNVGVSYNSDLSAVFTALRKVAEENPNILSTPQPDILLLEFGDSSWNMRLRVWISDPKQYYPILSELNCAIVEKFRQHNVEIPFPQRDLHVRSPLPVPLQTGRN